MRRKSSSIVFAFCLGFTLAFAFLRMFSPNSDKSTADNVSYSRTSIEEKSQDETSELESQTITRQANILCYKKRQRPWSMAASNYESDESPFNIDKRTPSVQEIIQELDSKGRAHVPYKYLYDHLDWANEDKRFPCLFNLKVNNEFWQKQRLSVDTQLYMHSAHLDVRPANSYPNIRVLAQVETSMNHNLTDIGSTINCITWFENDPYPDIRAPSEVLFVDWPKLELKDPEFLDYSMQNLLITCPIPDDRKHSVALISLVPDVSAIPTNALSVDSSKQEARGDFVVCLKALESPYDDLSVRLIEWLEIVRRLGANKVDVYVLTIHPNMTRVLDYYNNQGFVQTTVGFSFSNVVVMDFDEMIVPFEGDDWNQMMVWAGGRNPRLRKRYDSLNFRHVQLFDQQTEQKPEVQNIPKEFHMLSHTIRSSQSIFQQHKSILFTDFVVRMTTHDPKTCLRPNSTCNPLLIPQESGLLFHYRNSCVDELSSTECEMMKSPQTEDLTLFKKRKTILAKMKETLVNLRFLKHESDLDIVT